MKIALISGDGVGPEIVEEGVKDIMQKDMKLVGTKEMGNLIVEEILKLQLK